jgi:outer membrane protein
MKHSSQRIILLSTVCAALLLAPTFGFAQDKPTSEMTIEDVRVMAEKNLKEIIQIDQTGEDQVFLGAIVTTYESNPDLKSARAQLRSVFEQLPQADAGWKPQLSAEADVTNNTVDTNADNRNKTTREGSLALEQPIFRGGSTYANISAAQNSIRAAIANLESIEQSVLLNAVTAYTDVIQNEALLRLAKNNQAVIKTQLDQTKARFEVGELTRTDVSQAEARMAQADAGVIAADGNLRASRATYQRVIGTPPASLKFPSFTPVLPDTLDDAVTMAEKWNPDVRSAQHAQRAAGYRVNSAYGELLPQVSLRGGISKTYDPISGNADEQDASSIGVVATVPLYEGGATRSRIREAKQLAIKSRSDIAARREDARQNVVRSWETLKAAEAEIMARQSQVQAAEIARFGVKREAELGARTVLDTLDADQEVLNAQVALVTALRNEIIARYSLAAALGLLTPKTMGFADKMPDYNREVEAVRAKFLSTSVDRVGK